MRAFALIQHGIRCTKVCASNATISSIVHDAALHNHAQSSQQHSFHPTRGPTAK
ncbi:hypothetical protein PENSPDRAFT_430249 [Peniophora sp. CONT]|nr:hypothetical protein PENSPDRAFT_430249 [Peniophora sp. CONT]